MSERIECWTTIVGGGMAGVSLAAALSSHPAAAGRPVCILEMEPQPGYHSTGRSAAFYSPTYGNEVIRALTGASRLHYWRPPAGFSDVALVHPRTELYVAQPQTYRDLDAMLAAHDALEEVSRARVHALCPILRQEIDWRGAVDRSGFTADLDVDAILQGYLRQARARGARLIAGAHVGQIERRDGKWETRFGDTVVRSALLVNAAGAWADPVAGLAGLGALGMTPLRRTAIVVDAPGGVAPGDWPFVIDAGLSFYFRPDAGRILISPVDETPAPAGDVQPEELDVAYAVERFEGATTMTISRVPNRWAGLRTFASDGSPVVGFDPRADGFFWCAALGGYGIQMAPALASAAASLMLTGELPAQLVELGLHSSTLSPARLCAHSAKAASL